ncbi:hypothetical protein [Streptomyces sp. NPDC047928]|uniref:hypothetical protein n=1 Tax=unclassified Streptomyces TaxID=2593676 RepID=UPI00371CF40A
MDVRGVRPARLDLGIVLRALARDREARRTLVAALKSPRQAEAAAHLRALGVPAPGVRARG